MYGRATVCNNNDNLSIQNIFMILIATVHTYCYQDSVCALFLHVLPYSKKLWRKGLLKGIGGKNLGEKAWVVSVQ